MFRDPQFNWSAEVLARVQDKPVIAARLRLAGRRRAFLLPYTMAIAGDARVHGDSLCHLAGMDAALDTHMVVIVVDTSIMQRTSRNFSRLIP